MSKKVQILPLAFDEFQIDRLISFVEDVEKHIGFRNLDGKVIKVSPSFSNHWVHGFDEYLPFINEALSYDPRKIKFLDQLIKEYNALNNYPLDKSKDAVVSFLGSLSKKYGFKNIPLVYTTASSPQKENFPLWVWNELPNTGRIKEDFGHIDFINAVLALEKEKVLKVKKVDILTLDHVSFTLKLMVDYLKPTARKRIELFISKEEGIYTGDTKKLSYPVHGKRFLIIRNLKDGKLSGTLLAKAQKRSLNLIIKEIGLINDTFQKKIGVKEDLIVRMATSGYMLNKDFDITFLD